MMNGQKPDAHSEGRSFHAGYPVAPLMLRSSAGLSLPSGPGLSISRCIGRRRTGASMRRGGVYITVLGASMLVSLIGITALAAVRIERVHIATASDAEQARLYAQSAVELGAQIVRNDPLWRATRPNGIWIADRPIGDGTFTLEGFDPIDGNFLNRPIDPLVLRATATRGRARQIVEARLDAVGEPLNVLETALYTTGELRVRNNIVLRASGAPVGTSTTLRNDGELLGNAECLLYTGGGTVTGDLTIGALPRILPTSDIFAMYSGLGTPISPGDLINRHLLAPGVNPWGPANPDGVYVIRTDQDLTIRDSRIHGTLVIIAPGRTVTIAGRMLMHNAREDHPVLLIDGDLVLNFYGDDELSESVLSTNFNPPAAPYEGISNTNTTDTYPSRIQGLVHIRGKVEVTGLPAIRGTVIVESGPVSQAVDLRNKLEIDYDPQVIFSPPIGYMQAVEMEARPGSWRQVVAP